MKSYMLVAALLQAGSCSFLHQQHLAADSPKTLQEHIHHRHLAAPETLQEQHLAASASNQEPFPIPQPPVVEPQVLPPPQVEYSRRREYGSHEVVQPVPVDQPAAPVPAADWPKMLPSNREPFPIPQPPAVEPQVQPPPQVDYSRPRVVVQPVSVDQPAASASPWPAEHQSPLGNCRWQMLATWVILIAVSLFARHAMMGKNWIPTDRATCTAALIIMWTVVGFATLFFMFSTHQWTFIESIYFCVTTVTTVGYGDYVPEDYLVDKILLLVFIWSNMLVLSIVMSLIVSNAVNSAEGSKGKGWHSMVLMLVGMTLGGALVFSHLEGWTFSEGIYFATVTLSTVGYGGLLVKGPTHQLAASVFMLVGVPMTGSLVSTLGGMIDDRFKARKAAMSSSKLLATYITIVIGWLLFGATTLHAVNGHGWNWHDCFYLAAVTMTTVGYGDFVPDKTVADQVFTIVFIWGSILIIAAIFGDMDALIMNDITAGMKRHKALMTRVGVLGAILLTGIISFFELEGWTVLDAFIYTSISCTTVGYGHLLPSTPAAKMWAVPFLLAAVPMTGCVVGDISSSYSDEVNELIADAE